MTDAIAGHLEPFGPEVKSIVVYLKWIELYFELLTFMEYLITTETRGAVHNEANGRLERVYEPKKVAMVAGFHFHWHQQQPLESMAMYLEVAMEVGRALSVLR